MDVIEIETKRRTEIVDITDEVAKRAGGSAVLVYTPHTTTAVIINEGESRLIEDVINFLERIAPRGAGYRHDEIDSNADAHIKASLLGNAVVVPVENGRLALGTWQRILFVELDGPRLRRVYVKLL
ncbi:MAG: secondary thiamine-phosphate synthase enzyme YjbQ [Archaeoglobaceae archaeon]